MGTLKIKYHPFDKVESELFKLKIQSVTMSKCITRLYNKRLLSIQLELFFEDDYYI